MTETEELHNKIAALEAELDILIRVALSSDRKALLRFLKANWPDKYAKFPKINGE